MQDAEAPLEASETQDAIFAMNNYMLDLDASGITLGYTEVANLGDQITIPTGALRGLIANLAIEMAPDFGGQITAGLQRAAVEGLNTMRKISRVSVVTLHPSTLPLGAGNVGSDSFDAGRFYPGPEANILAETTGSIGLESGTEAASP